MIEQSVTQEAPAAVPAPPTHLLITISTPGCPQPIARLGSKQELLGGATIRTLLERSVSLRAPASQGVPVAQLESELTTVLAIGELLASDTVEIVAKDSEGPDERLVRLDELAQQVAQEHIDEQGGVFWTLTLEVRPARERIYTAADERRQVATPAPDDSAPTTGDTPTAPAAAPGAEASADAPAPGAAAGPPPVPTKKTLIIFDANEQVSSVRVDGKPGPVAAVKPEVAPSAPARKAAKAADESKGYIRKTDLLRAQFLPEVDALDLSGLFVAEFGAEIRPDANLRNIVVSDPSRTTDTLLKGNGFRRVGDHTKALGCYQELVDMDPSNPDFRFLCGTMLKALGHVDGALEAFTRARELGHEGAQKEIDELRKATPPESNRRIFGFLKFWKQ